MAKYTIIDAYGRVIQEHKTFRDLVTELRGNHYSFGSYSKALVGGNKIIGFPTIDPVFVDELKRYIDQGNTPTLQGFLEALNR